MNENQIFCYLNFGKTKYLKAKKFQVAINTTETNLAKAQSSDGSKVVTISPVAIVLKTVNKM